MLLVGQRYSQKVAKGLNLVFRLTGMFSISSSVSFCDFMAVLGLSLVVCASATLWSHPICFLISAIVGRSSSPADLDGGALEMLIFFVGLSLFQLAKHLSKAYLRVVVSKVIWQVPQIVYHLF